MTRYIYYFLLGINMTYAQHSFSDLVYVDIQYSDMNGKFGYEDSSDFQLINKICNESLDCFEFLDTTVLIGYWHLKNESKIEIHYTEAPSDDPRFIATYQGQVILEEAGLTLHFKENTLYIEGKANSCFDNKRKFELIDYQYLEVKQPYYYIGIQGSLNYPIQIYETDKFENKVAQLPKGYEIEVLVGQVGNNSNDLEKVLIKTKFGLTGWFDFKKVVYGKPIVDGLSYYGD